MWDIDDLYDEAISIRAGWAIYSGTYVGASDIRIKNDISDVNIADSLSLVNQIECKNYNYIDVQKNSNTRGKVTGFIAQQVKEIYPKAVSKTTDFTPDVLKVIDVKWCKIVDVSGTGIYGKDVSGADVSRTGIYDKDVSGNIKYSFTIDDLDLSSNHTGNCRFYVSNDPSGNDEVMKEVRVEPDNKTFIFDTSWNNVFFYGKEVKDFHVVDKNKIFQLHHPAIQQLSKLNDEKTEQITQLIEKTEELTNENTLLKERLTGLENRLLALESR